ncbi:hypothetical protein QAD02_009479 [Eretmocerus hayati]|uniref:Uncharacterized protein n=1 Tax=Eretmocerus hayati TaxID=131215 RepID=A0ACC2NA74_9HYME|nr:hypothetical protein QAD02_009479 [Eretmocerus hayati]
MEAAKINQKEYLKRYLSKGDGKKKKKKKKINVGPKKVKIIDDDIDLQKLTSLNDNEIDIFNATEDAPQIVGIIDERGPVDFDNKQRWKVIADDGTGDIAISRIEEPQKKHVDTAGNNVRAKQASHKSLKTKEWDKGELSEKKKHRNHRSDSNSSSSSSSSDSDNDARKASKKRRDRSRKAQKKKKRDENSSSDSGSDSDSSNNEPQRKKRERRKSDDDNPRSNTSHNSSNRKRELSPRRRDRNQNGSDSDMSLPRPRKESKSTGQQSVRSSHKYDEFDVDSDKRSKTSKRNQSDSDLSPPRTSNSKHQKKRDASDSDLSPPRLSHARANKRKGSSDSDLSPPRKSNSKTHRNKNGSDSDLSPPRKSRQNKDQQRFNSDRDHSREYSSRDRHVDKHDRKSYHKSSKRYSSHASRDSSKYDSDLSPPRSSTRDKTKSSRWDEGSRKSCSPERKDTREKGKLKKKTMDGKIAGLRNLQSLKEEEEALKKRNAEMMKKINKDNGFGQATVVRDRKTGRKRDLDREAAEKLEKQREQEEINAKYAVWGRGLKQTEDRGDQMKRDLHEMNKPLARYADDQDLESELKSRDRGEDPMLAYMKEKEINEGKRAPEAPKYEGSYMPNRFGIRPGHRWDGVDRSNGFEKKWFEARNSRKAVEEEAYKWSSADM